MSNTIRRRLATTAMVVALSFLVAAAGAHTVHAVPVAVAQALLAAAVAVVAVVAWVCTPRRPHLSVQQAEPQRALPPARQLAIAAAPEPNRR